MNSERNRLSKLADWCTILTAPVTIASTVGAGFIDWAKFGAGTKLGPAGVLGCAMASGLALWIFLLFANLRVVSWYCRKSDAYLFGLFVFGGLITVLGAYLLYACTALLLDRFYPGISTKEVETVTMIPVAFWTVASLFANIAFNDLDRLAK